MKNQIENFLRTVVIPPVIGAVVSGKAISAQFSVTGDRRSHQFPLWIDVIATTMARGNADVPALHARTNDMDLEVGYPPSFHITCPVSDEQALTDAICAFLATKLEGQDRIEVFMRASSPRGMADLKPLVGNSDDGTLDEQPEHISL